MHEAVDEALLELLNVVLETGDEVVDLNLDVIPRAREWVRLLVLVLGEPVSDDLDVDLWVRNARPDLSVNTLTSQRTSSEVRTSPSSFFRRSIMRWFPSLNSRMGGVRRPSLSS